jgi:SAM-dependent methyltransferase
VPVSDSWQSQGGSLLPKDGSTFFDQAGDFIRRYIWASSFMKGKSVLDAGCGVGYGSNYLATTGATDVLGIDSDPQAISYALNTYKKGNCNFRLMNVENIDGTLASSFDGVVSFEVIPYLSDIDGYLRGINKVLRNGAVYLLSAPNRHSLLDGKSGNKLHKKEYYPQELASILRGYFNIAGMYVEFDKTYSASEIRDLWSQEQSIPNKVARALIPASVRGKIPLRGYWNRHLGGAYPTGGRYLDFEILKVDKLEEMDARFSNQLFLCIKP